MCKNKHRDRIQTLNPESLSQTHSHCGAQFPSPIPPKPAEEQDRTCLWGVGGGDSAPKTVCLQQITSRKIIPLGSPYLEVQLKYDHCLEN